MQSLIKRCGKIATLFSAVPFLFWPINITVTVGGDVMLDRHMRAVGEKSGYAELFDNIYPLFKKADIGIVNLEGPITSHQSKTLLPNGHTTDSYTFTFATSTAKVLHDASIDLVSLANNHSDNFGISGLNETKFWLENAKVDWFGDPGNATGTEKIKCVEKGLFFKSSVCIAFVGYHEFRQGLNGIISDVQRLSEKYPVVVIAHWGDEYEDDPPERVKEKARMFVDAGAILIIGSHPHVVGKVEWIDNVPVIYSLGNLVFDQYFDEEVMKGQIAEIAFKKKKDSFKIEKIRLHEISNKSKSGPVLTGGVVEIKR